MAALWPWANTIGSLGIALIWGVGLSNLLYGVPIDSSGDFDGGFSDLFNVYTLLGGIAVVLLFAFHGATYLTLRTTGELCGRAAGGRRLAIGNGRRRRVPDLDGRGRGRPERQGRLPPVLPAAIAIVAIALAAVCVYPAAAAGVRAHRRRNAQPRGDALHLRSTRG